MKKTIFIFIFVIGISTLFLILLKRQNDSVELSKKPLDKTKISTAKSKLMLENDFSVNYISNNWQDREYLADLLCKLDDTSEDLRQLKNFDEVFNLLVDAIPNKKPFTPVITVTYEELTNVIARCNNSNNTKNMSVEYIDNLFLRKNVNKIVLTNLLEELVSKQIENKLTNTNQINSIGPRFMPFMLCYKSLLPHIVKNIITLHRIDTERASIYAGMLNSHYYPDARIAQLFINRIIPLDSPLLYEDVAGTDIRLDYKARLLSELNNGLGSDPDCLLLAEAIINNPDKFTWDEWKKTGTSCLHLFNDVRVEKLAEIAFEKIKKGRKYWGNNGHLRFYINDGKDYWMETKTSGYRNDIKMRNPPVFDVNKQEITNEK